MPKRPVKGEEQPRKRQGMYIDYDLAELLKHIHKVMNAPQSIKLARELVRSSEPKTIRATLPDAKDFLEELEQKVGSL